jgi:hypothetical protein
MYHKIEENQRVTDIEAAENYPDSYIIVRRDSMYSEAGTVLYIGDNMGELISLSMTLNEPFCGILEGLNHRRSLGGVVIGG